MSAGDLIFLDTETTGLDETRGEIWEIGLIRRSPTLVGFMSEPNIAPYTEDEYVLQLRPDLGKASEKALEVGRFAERFLLPDGIDAGWVQPGRVSTRETFATALFDLAGYLYDATIVCAQPAFDTAFLKALLRRYDRRIPWHYRLVCVESLAAGKLGKPIVGLAASARALGIEVDDSVLHTAIGDARLARSIYDAVVVGAS